MEQRRRQLLLYIVLLCISGTGIYLALSFATGHRVGPGPESAPLFSAAYFLGNLHSATSHLLLQIVLVLVLAGGLARVCRYLGMPEVIGEIAAGITLGPSVLGILFPDLHGFFFPQGSLASLHGLAHLGLILFLFLIGMEIEGSELRKSLRTSIVISHSTIMLVFTLAMGLSYFLYERYAPSGVTFLSFSLFMGIAMSITAFPVLARIIQERGLLQKRVGSIALTAAAIDDVTAWCILAVVVAIVQSTGVGSSLLTAALSIVYVLTMVYVVRPFLKRVSEVYFTREIIGRGVTASVVLLALCSAVATELIGLHAFFGAFLAGVILPADSRFRRIISEKLQDFAGIILLPLFFAFTGLRTNLLLLNSQESFLTVCLIMFVAVAGKMAGAWMSGLASGFSLRESLQLGALINTRGLVELIVLNIGFDLGVISKELFAMLVLMAVVTTVMTGPLLTLFKDADAKKPVPGQSGIMFAFGPLLAGISLTRLSSLFLQKGEAITAVHLYSNANLIPRTESDWDGIFAPLKQKAGELGKIMKTHAATSGDIAQDIVSFAQTLKPGLLLMGAARSIFSKNRIGGKVGDVIRDATCPVGIFVEKDLQEDFKSAGILYSRKKDQFLLDLGSQLQASGLEITVIVKDESLMEDLVKEKCPFPMRLYDDVYADNDLLLISVADWLEKRYTEPDWMDDPPCSLLLLRGG